MCETERAACNRVTRALEVSFVTIKTWVRGLRHCDAALETRAVKNTRLRGSERTDQSCGHAGARVTHGHDTRSFGLCNFKRWLNALNHRQKADKSERTAPNTRASPLHTNVATPIHGVQVQDKTSFHFPYVFSNCSADWASLGDTEDEPALALCIQNLQYADKGPQAQDNFLCSVSNNHLP